MRTAVLFLVLFSAGIGVSRSFAKAPADVSSPPGGATTPAASDCSGGAEAPLEVALVPESIDRSGGSDVLQASVRIEHRGEAPAQVKYSLEVVSDTGESLFRAPGPVRRLEKKGSLPPGLLRTPRGLSDGFYQARVTANSTGADGDTELMDHLYFEVRGGGLTLLDADDWYSKSRINEGVAQ